MELAARRNRSLSISASWLRKVACMAALTPLLSTRLLAQTGSFDHRWNGVIFDAFTFDGNEFWTVEDGGRIRHRTAAGAVHFQDVPDPVKDTLHRIHFVPDDDMTDGPTGWAVGEMGWILKTLNGGTTWNISPWCSGHQCLSEPQYPAVLTLPGHPNKETLWDVHFLDENRGWLLGLHGIWFTDNGGSDWLDCTVRMQDNRLIFPPVTQQDKDFLEAIEFYALDVVERPGPVGSPATETELIGMAAAQPGLVFKTTNGIDWKVVLDIRCLCFQSTPGCPAQGCESCYDCSQSNIQPIDGCLMQPGNRGCEKEICGNAEEDRPFEAWDIDVSGHPTEKLAVLVGGIRHDCGMVFTSVDDGVHWKKESNECDLGATGGGTDCVNDPAFKDLPKPTPPIPPNHPWYSHVYKQRAWGALYGVAIFDGDNSAILAGYGGVHSYRAPSIPIWRDVSEYNNRIDEVPNAVTMPLMGATASQTGSLTTGKGFIVGMGGFIREKDASGTGWGDAAGTEHGSPWRIRDIHFIDDQTGFQVGQFCRIAKTTDAGAKWSHAQGFPIFDPAIQGGDGPTLKAVTFVPAGFTFGGQYGVTVGGILSDGKPAIYRTLDAGVSDWEATDTTTGFSMAPGGVAAGLLDVAFAGITSTSPQEADYWAAGDKGLMLHSSDSGRTWNQYIPIPPGGGPPSQPTNFTINGVAYKDISTGIFVGKGYIGIGTPVPPFPGGLAFQRKRLGNPVWRDITPPQSAGVMEISDVVIAGDIAYAVGEKWVGMLRSGVVLKSVASGGNFGQFVVVDEPVTGFPLCLTNEPANDLVDTPVLTEAEIDPAGDLWVGGQCGRVWKLRNTTWTEFKSQTDTHILGISFGVGSSVMGYFGGHRDEFPQGCVVRYQ